MIESSLGALYVYARARHILIDDNWVYARNRILEVLKVRDYDVSAEAQAIRANNASSQRIDDILEPLLDEAASRGLIDPNTRTQRDLWDTAVMGCFLGQPSEINDEFWCLHSQASGSATDYFHNLSVASNYIRVDRTDKNPQWTHDSRYGTVEITINISKPEKDPRDIAAEVGHESSGYPECLLCKENEGYAGGANHPARQNLRLIPMDLYPIEGEDWLLQYSPYRYFNEHCIVLSPEHRPMLTNEVTLWRLAGFVDLFPHYLIGSNADIPIVGGSILSHDHFQGGAHEFPMDRASVEAAWSIDGLRVEVLNWPLSVIRLTGAPDQVVARGSEILARWRDYDEPSYGIVAHSDDEPHNAVTPIARTVGSALRLDLVLRNNRTTPEHPFGIFHPHEEIHPIKRENIGLIEVLGLAVLPARLESELRVTADCLVSGADLPVDLAGHAPMLEQLRARSGTVESADEAADLVRNAAGNFFVTGLEHCGVFGPMPVDGCEAFLRSIGWTLDPV